MQAVPGSSWSTSRGNRRHRRRRGSTGARVWIDEGDLGSFRHARERDPALRALFHLYFASVEVVPCLDVDETLAVLLEYGLARHMKRPGDLLAIERHACGHSGLAPTVGAIE